MGQPEYGTTSMDAKNLAFHVGVCRLIVRYEGGGLSMLQTITNEGLWRSPQRENQRFRWFFVTKVYKSGHFFRSPQPTCQIPNS